MHISATETWLKASQDPVGYLEKSSVEATDLASEVENTFIKLASYPVRVLYQAKRVFCIFHDRARVWKSWRGSKIQSRGERKGER